MKYLLSLCLVLSFAFATSYQSLDLETMLSNSEIAFYARVESINVIEKDNQPWTQVNFEILEPFKGLAEDRTLLTLEFLGGDLGSSSLQVQLMPSFSEGETLVIFAYDAAYYSPIVGFRQGLWREIETGFISEMGSYLGLDAEGQLALTDSGVSPSDLFAALRLAFAEADQ